MKVNDFAALSYVMLIDRSAPRAGVVQHGRRLEQNLHNFFKEHEKNFSVSNTLFIDSDKVKRYYWESGHLQYLRSILERITKMRNSSGGLHIPDFFVIDGEFILQKPKDIIVEYEDSPIEKFRPTYTILTSLLIFLNDQLIHEYITPKIPLFIFARKSTVESGYFALLKDAPYNLFQDTLKIQNATEQWELDFNNIVNRFTEEKIAHQFDFHFSILDDTSTTFDFSGISVKLADLYDKKKATLLEYINYELNSDDEVDIAANVRNNFSNEEFCFNGALKNYSASDKKSQNANVFYITGGSFNLSTREDVEKYFFNCYDKVWGLACEKINKVEINLEQAEIDSTTSKCLEKLIHNLLDKKGLQFFEKHNKSLDENLSLNIPTFFRMSMEQRVEYKNLEMYLKSEANRV